MKNGKIKNGPMAARRKSPMPKAAICFCSSIIPLMINKILKNPNIKGKIWENIIINPFAIISHKYFFQLYNNLFNLIFKFKQKKIAKKRKYKNY